MNVKIIIQHATSMLIFMVGIIFALLNVCGVVIIVNESDINNLIFGLGSLIAACIEIVPFIIQTIKDRNFAKILDIVNRIVDAVEELNGLSSIEKKRKALTTIVKECEAQGLEIDIDKIDKAIETAVALRNKIVK